MLNIFWTLKFIFFNKKKYLKRKSDKIVLVELFNYKASIISNGIFSNELAKLKGASLVGYEPYFFRFKDKIKNIFYKLNFVSYYYLYKSYGLSSILFPVKNLDNKKLDKLYKSILKNIKKKSDILNIKFETIKVGDLIYDSYLRENNKSTINIYCPIFLDYLKNSIRLYLYWSNYFNKNNVVGIVLSHSVYLRALPLRIACEKNIDVYSVSFSNVYKLTKNKPLKFAYFRELPKVYKTFDSSYKKELIKISKKNIKLRFSGKKDIVHKKNETLKHKIFLNKKFKKIKNPNCILIAAHDFNDAPHVHGKMIFADFFDWLNFLGKKSEEITKYRWLIKLHPAKYSNNLHHINFFLKKYPSLELLSKNITHNEILSKGIKCVLSSYGTIGHEYPIFGVPVINAGENRHSGYKFCLHPKNFKKYNYLINNISKIKPPHNIEKIYECYAMLNLVDFNIFEKLNFLEEKLDDLYIFNHFLSEYDEKDINFIENKYFNFIKSKKRRLIKFLH
jgi:hypothetical protein